MKTQRRIAAAVGAAALAASIFVGAAPASAQSKGDIEQAFTDYINGDSTAVMTRNGGADTWVFTYRHANGGGVTETYVGNRNNDLHYVMVSSNVWWGDSQRNSRPKTSDK